MSSIFTNITSNNRFEDVFPLTGDFSTDKFKANISAAVDQYILRVNDTPAMGTTIKLYRGVENSSFHTRRPHLLVFLKGSVAEKTV